MTEYTVEIEMPEDAPDPTGADLEEAIRAGLTKAIGAPLVVIASRTD
jgi:hypothetical protein